MHIPDDWEMCSLWMEVIWWQQMQMAASTLLICLIIERDAASLKWLGNVVKLQVHKIPGTKLKQPFAYKFLKILLVQKYASMASKLLRVDVLNKFALMDVHCSCSKFIECLAQDCRNLLYTNSPCAKTWNNPNLFGTRDMHLWPQNCSHISKEWQKVVAIKESHIFCCSNQHVAAVLLRRKFSDSLGFGQSPLQN